MKVKILIGVLVFLMVVNVATIGSFVCLRYKQERRIADFRGHGFSERQGRAPLQAERRRMMRFPREHRKQMRELLREFQTDTAELRLRVHELEAETFELMQRDPVPTAQVDSLLEEISAVKLGISKIATHKMIETKSLLSPEQQEMFFKAMLGPRPDKPGGRLLHEPGGSDKPRGRRRATE